MAGRYESSSPAERDPATREFSEEEKQIIEQRRRTLSSLALFIGKDFRIPVELNGPGQGWHWDFKNNVIRVDPVDLLEKPMDYLRFVISHEGGHRRISRVNDVIPDEVWDQPGFSFMTNAIEDPRDNNFVAENYPKFRDWMDLAYEMDLAEQDKARAEAGDTLGFQPRFMQAGFEYIRQWFREAREEESGLTPDLPDEVREVVGQTLEAARDSWWLYPSRQEADASEENIVRYAKGSYEINRDRVWPEFRKLVDRDREDQKMQEFLQDQKSEGEPGEGGSGGLPDSLTEEERQAIKGFLEGQSGEGEPIQLDQIPEGLKRKIKEAIDSLPEEARHELQERADQALKEFEQAISEALEGKLQEGEEPRGEPGEPGQPIEKPSERKEGLSREEIEVREQKAQAEYRELLDKILRKDRGVYDRYRQEVLPVIDRLENDLREIFVQRRAHSWETGLRSGKRIDIKRRIQEKVKGVLPIESKAWQRRELPMEKDYAITLLVDLSGSMSHGRKIQETFKAVVVLTEVLNRLSIALEVLGFNEDIYEYQKYGENLTQEMREKMGAMLGEVNSKAARYNDDGWALTEASQRLARQTASEKFLIALSDGQPEESPTHPRSRYSLSKVIKTIGKETDQRLIGLGIGLGTKHVSRYYPMSLADVELEEMAAQLAGVIKRVIEEPGR